MSPITSLLFRLPIVSGTLISAGVALGLCYALSPEAFMPLDEGECLQAEVAESLPPAHEPLPKHLALALEVTSATSGCMYYSSFDVGAVEVASDEPSRTLRRRFAFMDGCDWEAVELLERVGEGRYRYTYTEHPVSCAPGREAATACTRSGYAVERDDEDDHAGAEDSVAAEAEGDGASGCGG